MVQLGSLLDLTLKQDLKPMLLAGYLNLANLFFTVN